MTAGGMPQSLQRPSVRIGKLPVVPRTFAHSTPGTCQRHILRPCLASTASSVRRPSVVARAVDTEASRDSPLQQALALAKRRQVEAQDEREALEATAQDVAQLAVDAARTRRDAQLAMDAAVAEFEAVMKRQQDAAGRAATLREALRAKAAAGNGADVAPSPELLTAEADAAALGTRVQPLRMRVESLAQVFTAAQERAKVAENVAMAAMTKAEAAFKSEVHASVEVKETLFALGKTFSSDSSPAALAAAVVAASLPAGGVPVPLARALPSEPGMDGESAPKTDWVKIGVAAAVAAGGYLFLTQTAAGASVVTYLQSLVQMVAAKIGPIHLHPGEMAILETIYLLLFAVLCVPAVVRFVPGGSPVLGYLVGGFLVGPHALGLIRDVQSIKHIAEMGVVFMLFNIGLELSIERLQSMAKYVFGLGSVQVVLTLLLTAGACMVLAPISGSSAIILAGALAMSSTAVAVQVLEDRGEMGSRHGRAAFSVLLFQDLAVVVLLMLIPLLAPSESGASVGLAKIMSALGVAAVKAVICIGVIILGGRLLVQPLYRKISDLGNPEIFAATTLLLCIGTSLLTQICGLSLALGAFLAGLLISETEYALQVESDISSYKGLLMGLFFMSVGMEISLGLFALRAKEIILGTLLLVFGKLAVIVAVGPLFGLTPVTSARAGLLLAPGGEFAFVAFGEAVARKVLPVALTAELYLVVALSMALLPYLAIFGAKLGDMMDKGDVQALQPTATSAHELRDHVIILGYGRAGQVIAQLLSEQLIPFVALDVNAEAVAVGKKRDLPVYFGDAGSAAVLHLIGAEHAACAVVALDTPGANYRAVWTLAKHFPNVKTYVRAHDVAHGLKLELAGARAVVPETLEPSLQLAAAVLHSLDLGEEAVGTIVEEFRRNHLKELQVLSAMGGTTLGYGFSKQPTTTTQVATAAALAAAVAQEEEEQEAARCRSTDPIAA